MISSVLILPRMFSYCRNRCASFSPICHLLTLTYILISCGSMKSQQVCTLLLPTAPHQGRRPGAHGVEALAVSAVDSAASKFSSIFRRQQQRLLPRHPRRRPRSRRLKMTIRPTWLVDLVFLSCRSGHLTSRQSLECQIKTQHTFTDCGFESCLARAQYSHIPAYPASHCNCSHDIMHCSVH